MRRFVPLLALALVAGCSSRDHANPFDPGNPVTHGRPTGFAALAGPQLVELHWTRPSLSSDFSYRLARRLAGEADFRTIASVIDGGATGYLDFDLTNGVLCEYRLYYIFGGEVGGLPAEDSATPGPLRPWCADLARHSLIGATPDGRHIKYENSGFVGPTHVAVDPSVGRVWVSDTYNGEVDIIDPLGGAPTRIRGLAEPVALALDPLDRSAWVCDQAFNDVFHYTAAGASSPVQLPGTFGKPIGVATDPKNGTVWICDKGDNQVQRYTRTGIALGVTPVTSPSRVAVDSLTGDAWVTSFEGARLVRITAAGSVIGTLALSGPIGVAVDAGHDRIWVADARAGQVVAVTRGSTVDFRVLGLVETREIAVDVSSGEAWVTAPGLHALVRISATGAVLERLTGFTDPYGVALDPGLGRGP